MPEHIDRCEGRRLFGLDPEGYDQVRPAYPDWIFDDLCASGALFTGATTLEIGPGTGRATIRLLEHGAGPLTLLEPDRRFAEMLAAATHGLAERCVVRHETLEAAALPADHFDLVVAATSFHWVEPESGLRKVRGILKDGGTAALMWNVLQDLDKDDAFHDATQHLLADLATSPSGAPNTVPFALNRDAREVDARHAGFEECRYAESSWTLTLDTEQVGTLYESFAHIQRLDPSSRTALLGELKRIAADEFDGVVERNVTSCLYQLR